MSRGNKVMKKAGILAVLVIALGLVLSLGACNLNTVQGRGEVAEKTLAVESIKKIELDKVAATLNISAIKSEKVTYNVYENHKDLLKVEIVGDTLKIYSTSEKTLTGDKITFAIGTDTLEEISIEGAVKVNGTGTFTAENFKISVKGAADIDLKLDVANKTTLSAEGAAEVKLTGTTDELSIDLDGAADVRCKELKADSVAIDFDGAGDIEVHADTKLTANGNGVCNITYWGNATVDGSVSGIGRVEKGN